MDKARENLLAVVTAGILIVAFMAELGTAKAVVRAKVMGEPNKMKGKNMVNDNIDKALLEWHTDLITRGEHALAGKLLKAIQESQKPKAKAVVKAIIDGGLENSEVASICMVIFCAM